MAADGNVRDTIPSPSPDRAWAELTRTRYGRHQECALLCNADEHHRRSTACELDGHPYQACSGSSWCALHQHTPLIAEAATKIRELIEDEDYARIGEVLEAAMRHGELDTHQVDGIGRKVVTGIFVEATRLL